MKCDELNKLILSGEELTDDIKHHAAKCRSCAAVVASEDRFRRLVNSVEKVEAPQGFESAVMKRIESRRSRRSTSLFRPSVLAPASALIIVVVAFYILSGFISESAVEDLAVSEPAATPSLSAPADLKPDDGIDETGVPSSELAENTPGPRVPSEQPDKRKTEIVPESPAGGSRDLATGAAETITPPWLNPDVPGDPSPNVRPRRFTPGEILAELGIRADYEQEGWKVRSVEFGSIAERSGVKTGDVIKSLDGNKLDTQALEGRTITGQTLSVTRAGRPVVLRIRP